MDKRTFLKAIAVAGVASPSRLWAQSESTPAPLTNWAGNIHYSTDQLERPTTVGQIGDLIRTQNRLKVLGTRHCFSPIADSEHQLISLLAMDSPLELDQTQQTVTVAAGIRYGQLSPWLDEQGFALHNLASLPHISVAGACATGTHGSGDANGNLATAVTAMQLLTAGGETVHLSAMETPDEFRGAIVHLGALGVVTQLTLDVQPTFTARQYVYQHLPLHQVYDNFDEIMSSGYSVSLFTAWREIDELWIKIKEPSNFQPKPTYFGGELAEVDLHPIAELSAVNCTQQVGVSGPWYDRLPHFRMGFTPSSGEELQSEYFVPREHAVDALTAIERLSDELRPHLMISELRTIAADDLWMSPCYGRDSLAIHFTWKPDRTAVGRVLPLIERELGPFEVRPHWGKLFTIAPEILSERYERFADFKRLVSQYDPKGKFRNAYLSRILSG